MHWWPGNDWEYWNTNAPSPRNEYWSHCTHGSAQVEKYFLPWQRAYIYFYEVVVRRKIAEIGGPEAWALPYWNYSYHDPSNASTPWPRSRLPWVFAVERRVETLIRICGLLPALLAVGGGVVGRANVEEHRLSVRPRRPEAAPGFVEVEGVAGAVG